MSFGEQRPQRWRQFSLQTMLIASLGLSFFIGWSANRIRMHRRAVDAVRQVGGEITYGARPFAAVAEYLPTWLNEEAIGTVTAIRIESSSNGQLLAELGPHLERLMSHYNN